MEKINVYKEPYYFLTIQFKKNWVKVPSTISDKTHNKKNGGDGGGKMVPYEQDIVPNSTGKSQNRNREMAPEPAAFRSDSFLDDPNPKSKYNYVFFSPCVEVFNRIHLIFQSNPDLCQNIKMAEREKADRRRNRMQNSRK